MREIDTERDGTPPIHTTRRRCWRQAQRCARFSFASSARAHQPKTRIEHALEHTCRELNASSRPSATLICEVMTDESITMRMSVTGYASVRAAPLGSPHIGHALRCA